MESVLVLIGYLWAIGGVLWLLDRVPAYKGDKEQYFKREGESK